MKTLKVCLALGLAIPLLVSCTDISQFTNGRADTTNASFQSDAIARTKADLASESSKSLSSYELPGNFSKDTSLAKLREELGQDMILITDTENADGQVERTVVIFPTDDSRRAIFYFQDSNTMTGLQLIRVKSKTSLWHLPSGVRIGMSINNLQKANGRAFEFSGLDWDYGGAVVDWMGGKLQSIASSNFISQVKLDQIENAQEDGYPSGDSVFRSDEEALAQSRLEVVEIGVAFK